VVVSDDDEDASAAATGGAGESDATGVERTRVLLDGIAGRDGDVKASHPVRTCRLMNRAEKIVDRMIID